MKHNVYFRHPHTQTMQNFYLERSEHDDDLVSIESGPEMETSSWQYARRHRTQPSVSVMC